ncbi:MAG: hypothetical protein ACFFCD_02730 [Promethearchaeota archaeon]
MPKDKDESIKEQLTEISDSLEEIKFNLVQLLGSAPQQETKTKFDVAPIKELIDSMATEIAQENTLLEILEKIENISKPKQEKPTVASTEALDEIKETLQNLANLQSVQRPDVSSFSEKLEGLARQETVEAVQLELMKYPGNEIITEIREGIKKATGFDEIENIAATVSTKLDENLVKVNETLQNMDSRLAALDDFGKFTASLPEIFEKLQTDVRIMLDLEKDDLYAREEKARIEIERASDLLQTGVTIMDLQPTVEEIKSFMEKSIQEKEALDKGREETIRLLKSLYEELAKMREDIHELRTVEATLSTVKKFFDSMIAETEAYKEWESKEGNQT